MWYKMNKYFRTFSVWKMWIIFVQQHNPINCGSLRLTASVAMDTNFGNLLSGQSPCGCVILERVNGE